MAKKRGREKRERGGKFIRIKGRIIIGRQSKSLISLLSPVSPTRNKGEEGENGSGEEKVGGEWWRKGMKEAFKKGR